MSGGRILVVDDEITIRDTIGQFLQGEGYEVAYSSNGVDALGKVENVCPDVILLDLMMPGMGGREFITALHEELGLTQIPILVMTGIHGLPPHQALALGASDVIEKPFDIDDILNKIALAMFRLQTRGHEAGEGEHEVVRGAAGVEAHAEGGVVLIVERDLGARRYLDGMLAAHGFRVVTMGRVTEELPRLARVLEPRAVMLDLDAPGVDGLAALRRLRQEPELDQVPMLLACADASAARILGIEATDLAVEVRGKPISDQELLGFITAPPAHARRVSMARGSRRLLP